MGRRHRPRVRGSADLPPLRPRPAIARTYVTVHDVERERGPLRSFDRRIVEMYLDFGLSARDCGAAIHLSSSAVLRRLAALGIRRRKPGGSRTRLSQRDLRRTRFLYERLGLSLRAV